LDTLFTGKTHIHVGETSSTNEMASEALKNAKVIEGAMFSADVQTRGKGQRGRQWASLLGQNVLVSYVFFPVFLKTNEQFSLIKAVSLAVKDVLDANLIDKAEIKWPNDIYINGSKIAGILIESTMKGNFMGSSVIGIGVNVNQKQFGEVENATSVILETGKGMDIGSFRSQLSYFLEIRYLMIKQDLKSLDKAYENALFRKDVTSDFIINGERQSLKVIQVDHLGQIVLEDEFGRQSALPMHQVKMVI
jgi:BirA family biotin operon repressor/biotin-[acetyl-CoA-carboxylase] ligase